MPRFVISVTIENKPGLSDPEGDTILQDLVLRGGDENAANLGISQIRVAKMLLVTIESENANSAMQAVKDACDRLQLYNPLVSTVSLGLAADDAPA